jgi:hypothetical protein
MPPAYCPDGRPGAGRVPTLVFGRWSGACRILKRCKDLAVQICVGVQVTALIGPVPSGSIVETALRVLDEEHPRRAIPDGAAPGP